MSDSVNALIGQLNAQGQAALKPIDWGSVYSNLNAYRELQAKNAFGQMYQQAQNPLTGLPDMATLNRLVGSNPATAWTAPKLLQQASDAANAQFNAQGTQLENVARNSKLFGMANISLIKDPSDANVNAVMDDLAANGWPREQVEANRARLLGMKDPEDRRKLAYRYGQQQLDVLHQNLGVPGTLDTGMTVVGTQNVPSAGPYGAGSFTQTSGGVGVTAGPVTQGGQVTWQDKDGITHYGTWAQYNIDRNNGRVVGAVSVTPPAAPGAAAPGATPPAAAPGTQARPGVPNPGGYRLQPAATPSTPPPTPGGGTGGTTLTDTTGPQPGDQRKWEASSDQFTKDNAAAGDYQRRVFPLVQVAHTLAKGDVTLGEGSDQYQQIKSFIRTWASNLLGGDLQSLQSADAEKVRKYLQDYINQQGISGRSDAALSSAIAGNPNAHMSTLTVQQMVPVLVGFERMRMAALADFKRQGGHPNQYSDFLANWQTTHDPRAFMSDMLSEPQLKKIFAAMPKGSPQRRAWQASLDVIDQNPGVMSQAAVP